MCEKRISVGEKIRLGVIGFGVQGHFDLASALKVPGVELAGICDLYTGRIENAKELYGKDLYTTRNYKELLDRSDIDAVIIATHDVWHSRITIDALAKGKHVYCEKPMVYKIDEGQKVINAQKKYGKVLQVGSQRVSSIGLAKAKEMLAAGEIGKLNMVNAVYDRQSSIGAWEYTIPKDADAASCDWGRFIEATDLDAVTAQQLARVAGVLGENERDIAQQAKRAQRDVLHVPDGRGDDVERHRSLKGGHRRAAPSLAPNGAGSSAPRRQTA